MKYTPVNMQEVLLQIDKKYIIYNLILKQICVSFIYVQYDNFKRVFKAVEDMEGPMAKNIQTHFLLSDLLAK